MGCMALWWMHITQTLGTNTRTILYFVFSCFLVFYHGIQVTSLYDISVSIALFMAVFSITDSIAFLNFIFTEFIMLMGIQFYFLHRDGVLPMDPFSAMRTAFHIGGVVILYIFTRITINHRIQEKEKISRWRESLEANNWDMEDFLSNISHELRTPLNVVSGMTTILQKTNDSSELVSIREAGLRMAKQVDDIQDYTEIKRGELVLEEENYMCDSLVNDVMTAYNTIFRDSGIELKIDLDPETPAVLYGDIKKLHKIFRHLVGNALKFTRQGGVHVRIFPMPRDYGINLIIEVTDTGIGMARAEMARMSRGLYQANKKRTRSTGGIGIGLPIVYGFVHKMGGFVMVNSEKGRGTTVRLSIPQKVIDPRPCHTAEEAVMEPESFEGEKPLFTGVRALIVDDEPMNLVVASGLFKEYKMVTDTAESGMEALEKYNKEDYDVIFMDHMMPEMDGVEAMKRLREQAARKGKKPVFVALTANALSGAKEMFMKEGFDGFIAKPIDTGVFERVMKNVLPEDMIHFEGRSEE